MIAMGTLFVFSLKTSVMLTALYAVYKVAFRNSNQHNRNRATLLSFVTLSLLCSPLMTLFDSLKPASVASNIELGNLSAAIISDDATAATPTAGIDIAAIMIAIYGIGVIAMLAITLYNIAQLVMLIAKGQRSQEDKKIIIANSKYGSFSWFGYIVMTEEDYLNNYDVIRCHELQHIQLRHSADLFYLQVYKIFNWYNPIAYLVCRDLQVIHEYQADNAVLSTGFDAKTYQMLLLSKVISTAVPAVANGINNSQLKLRIIMMLNKKPTSGNRAAAAVLTPIAIIAAVAALNQPVIASTLDRLAINDAVTTANNESVAASDATTNSIISQSSEVQTQIVSTPAPTADAEAGTTATAEVLDKAPTYFIDGVESTAEQMQSLNPSEIKSMQIIKNDPAYPNGKLLISTKTPAAKSATKIPSFPGGEGEMINWLCENITYPADAPKDNKKHNVVVSFIVSKTGEIKDPTIVKSESIECLDSEALRVIKAMPKWEPGLNEDGEAIDVSFALPITFTSK
jgi:TonB family protein